jgi:hypothetical protein
MKKHIIKSSFLLALLLLFSFQTTENEQITVSGKVTSSVDNLAIPGCNILEKGSQKGVVTDLEGNYSINTEKGKTLVFSAMGFEKQEVKVKDAKLDVTLGYVGIEASEASMTIYVTKPRQVADTQCSKTPQDTTITK